MRSSRPRERRRRPVLRSAAAPAESTKLHSERSRTTGPAAAASTASSSRRRNSGLPNRSSSPVTATTGTPAVLPSVTPKGVWWTVVEAGTSATGYPSFAGVLRVPVANQRSSVAEMAPPREDHRDAAAVRRLDHFLVAHRSARLDDAAH